MCVCVYGGRGREGGGKFDFINDRKLSEGSTARGKVQTKDGGPL